MKLMKFNFSNCFQTIVSFILSIIYRLHVSACTFTGQLYVMMSPQEVLTGSNQRTIAPRTQPYIA